MFLGKASETWGIEKMIQSEGAKARSPQSPRSTHAPSLRIVDRILERIPDASI
jgi:hypothetical protein